MFRPTFAKSQTSLEPIQFECGHTSKYPLESIPAKANPQKAAYWEEIAFKRRRKTVRIELPPEKSNSLLAMLLPNFISISGSEEPFLCYPCYFRWLKSQGRILQICKFCGAPYKPKINEQRKFCLSCKRPYDGDAFWKYFKVPTTAQLGTRTDFLQRMDLLFDNRKTEWLKRKERAKKGEQLALAYEPTHGKKKFCGIRLHISHGKDGCRCASERDFFLSLGHKDRFTKRKPQKGTKFCSGLVLTKDGVCVQDETPFPISTPQLVIGFDILKTISTNTKFKRILLTNLNKFEKYEWPFLNAIPLQTNQTKRHFLGICDVAYDCLQRGELFLCNRKLKNGRKPDIAVVYPKYRVYEVVYKESKKSVNKKRWMHGAEITIVDVNPAKLRIPKVKPPKPQKPKKELKPPKGQIFGDIFVGDSCPSCERGTIKVGTTLVYCSFCKWTRKLYKGKYVRVENGWYVLNLAGEAPE